MISSATFTIAKLDKSIEALAEELLEYDLIQSIPGFGTKIAATILLRLEKSIVPLRLN